MRIFHKKRKVILKGVIFLLINHRAHTLCGKPLQSHHFYPLHMKGLLIHAWVNSKLAPFVTHASHLPNAHTLGQQKVKSYSSLQLKHVSKLHLSPSNQPSSRASSSKPHSLSQNQELSQSHTHSDNSRSPSILKLTIAPSSSYSTPPISCPGIHIDRPIYLSSTTSFSSPPWMKQSTTFLGHDEEIPPPLRPCQRYLKEIDQATSFSTFLKEEEEDLYFTIP